MIKRKGLIKSRRGLSEVIVYILLISMSIILSTIVYQWLKSYVPAESPGCSDGVSLLLEDYKYDCTAKKLELNLKNNGRFGIAGFFIHATTKPDQELATLDLSGNSTNGDSGFVRYSTGAGDENIKAPGPTPITESFTNLFFGSGGSICPNGGNTPCIYSLELIPIRYEDVNDRNIGVSCTNAKITQELSCYVAPVISGQTCGADGVEGSEVCDDGDTSVASCAYGDSPPLTQTCSDDCMLMIDCANPQYCGDGTLQAANEECDLGLQNGASNSGCSSTCDATDINIVTLKYPPLTVFGFESTPGDTPTLKQGWTIANPDSDRSSTQSKVDDNDNL